MTEGDIEDTLSKIDIGTAATWRAAGLSRGQLYSLVGSGQLVKLRHGAYATSGILARAETDPGLRHALDVAAVRGTRTHTGVASHHSAAQMWRLGLLNTPPDGTVTVTVPPGSRAGRYRQARVIRHAAELPDEHVTKLYGIPVTTAARTIIDIARAATFMEGVVVADSALYERHTSKAELRRVLVGCQRWPGVSQARQVVDFANGLAESVLESCARVSFREQGLPAPMLQVHISGRDRTVIARVDFCWPRHNTIAEADGLLKYDSGEKAIAELRRDRLLREAGYEVIHFTWRELFAGPARVAGRIRAALARTGSGHRVGADLGGVVRTEGAAAVSEKHGGGRARGGLPDQGEENRRLRVVDDRRVQAVSVRGGDRLRHDGNAKPAGGQIHDSARRGGLQRDFQLQAPRRAALLENRTDARTQGHANQRETCEILESKPRPFGIRMIFTHGRDEPFRHYGQGTQPRGETARADEGYVQGAGAQLLYQRGGIFLSQCDGDPGVGAVERGEGVEQRGDRARGDHTHGESPCEQAGNLFDRLAETRCGGKYFSRVLHGHLARGSERRGAA